jgi:hypothetical protein
MRAGDEIICMHCGANSFLVKKAVMDGWTKKEEILACSSCSEVVEKICKKEELLKSKTKEQLKEKSLDKFSSFIGVEQVKKPAIDDENNEKYFCRDCRHYISHPFLDRCSLNQVEVNPMDDCKSFERKKECSEN